VKIISQNWVVSGQKVHEYLSIVVNLVYVATKSKHMSTSQPL